MRWIVRPAVLVVKQIARVAVLVLKRIAKVGVTQIVKAGVRQPANKAARKNPVVVDSCL